MPSLMDLLGPPKRSNFMPNFIARTFKLLAVIGVFFHAGCSPNRGSREVDVFLDQFQAQIETVESKLQSGSLSPADLQRFSQEGQATAMEFVELSRKHELSEGQSKRSKELATRMQTISAELRQRSLPAARR